MAFRKELGNRGEALARRYLEQNGYKIIAANFRIGRNEFDLIAQYKGKTIFFEIKTRLKTEGSEKENGTDCFSANQAQGLKRAINAYCLKNRLSGEKIRLDLIIISVNSEKGRADLKHYKNIF
jgi:putative endonuclease